jgi:RNA recognition motif-containing protein
LLERNAISNKVFVGNLSFDVTRDELIEAFSAAGKVVDAKVPTDRETGRPRGFAFVEFENDEAAQKSISLMNGRDLKGRPLRVNEAENRPPRAPGSAPPFRPRPGGPPPFRPGGGGGFRSGPPSGFPPPPGPDFEGRGEGRGRRFRGGNRERTNGGETRRPPGRPRNPRRRRDDVQDDDDY